MNELNFQLRQQVAYVVVLGGLVVQQFVKVLGQVLGGIRAHVLLSFRASQPGIVQKEHPQKNSARNPVLAR